MNVFYSWQSDLDPVRNQNFIQACLEKAASILKTDETLAVEPVVDRDVAGLPGSPDIASAILLKIDRSDVFVADVTIVNGPQKHPRPMPNPNVLIETGYALKKLGCERSLYLQNTAFGSPEELPFDLRHRRIIEYRMTPDDDIELVKGELTQKIVEQLRLLLKLPNSADGPINLVVDHRMLKQSEELHTYELDVSLRNTSQSIIGKYHCDVEFPTKMLLREPERYRLFVRSRSNEVTSVFRGTSVKCGEIYPNDTKQLMSLTYKMDDETFDKHGDVLNQEVRITAYVNGTLAASEVFPARDIQLSFRGGAR